MDTIASGLAYTVLLLLLIVYFCDIFLEDHKVPVPSLDSFLQSPALEKLVNVILQKV